MGFPVVGVPKTIDNDLAATELTFGFMTAIDIATEALDRLHTTAESHNRVMILEVMGRNTGWIALHAGLTGSADVILIPEIPFVMEKVVEAVKARDASGSRFTNIVVAEGASELGGEEIYLESGTESKAKRSAASANICVGKSKKRPEKNRAPLCWDICSAAAARILLTGCWRRISAPAPFIL
jgi:6-phosphofructokinase